MSDQEEKLEVKSLLSWVPIPRIKSNGLRRTITGLTLIAYFHIVVYYGLPLILLHALAIEIKCHDEIINIAIKAKKVPNVLHFRTLNWYFVIIANYFFFGETFADYLELFIGKYYVIKILFSYHRFLSFCLYFLGIIWFLTRLRRKFIRQQFSLLAWTHFLLIIIGLQSYMVVQNIFEGIIWLIIPVCVVILNDIFAYVFGRLLGKTPLISLSPNKTMEGFIFGGISTLVLGAFLSYIFCHISFLTCPVRFMETEDGITMNTNCTPSYFFQPIYYDIGNTGISIKLFPFLLHSLSFSLFASVIAPFGGFCASGFKRAFKVKDFSDLIPGHGGLTDRFDCQFLMATFVNVYIGTFIRIPQVDKIYQKVFQLTEENQLKFYLLLNESLHTRGLMWN
nr:gustatory receptor 10 [Monochamus saltuarius]